MTINSADEEMKFIHQTLLFNKIDKLSCLGAADGIREPISILQFLKKYDKTFPEEIFLTDISSKLIKKAKEHISKELNSTQYNIHEKSTNFKYLVTPLQLLNKDSLNLENFKNSIFVLGCYNFCYLKNALKIYKDEQERIGTHFTLKVLMIKEDVNLENYIKKKFSYEIEVLEEFNFDINYEESYMWKIKDWQDNYWRKPKFYAISVETDKNFVSHYFSKNTLNFILNRIFKNDNIAISNYYNYSNFEEQEIKSEDQDFEKLKDKRYIINLIQKKEQPNHLITMLNNVLGNIPFSDHSKILTMISDYFFENDDIYQQSENKQTL